jgi:hypothetical protein
MFDELKSIVVGQLFFLMKYAWCQVLKKKSWSIGCLHILLIKEQGEEKEAKGS